MLSGLDEKVSEVLDYYGSVTCKEFTPTSLTAIPKQVSYKRTDGQMELLPLEYMNSMLSDKEMEVNMLIPTYEKQ